MTLKFDEIISPHNTKEISALFHEIAQPLMVSSTYVTACINLLKNNCTDSNYLLSVMEKINDNIHITGEKFHALRDIILNMENLSISLPSYDK